MKNIFLLLFLDIIYLPLFSQNLKLIVSKPPIDSAAIVNWESFGNTKEISNDGNYFMYSLYKEYKSEQTLIIRSTQNDWKKEIPGIGDALFSGDNKQVVYLTHDTLCFLQMGTDEIKKIANVSSYSQPSKSKGQWAAYQLNTSANRVVILNLLNGLEYQFDSVSDYHFDGLGKAILLKTISNNSDRTITHLEWLNLQSGKAKTIWTSDSSRKVGGCSFDASGTQLTFNVQEAINNEKENSIWYFKEDDDRASIKVNSKSKEIEEGFRISNKEPYFSKDGKYIYFQIEYSKVLVSDKESISVDVWSYKDTVIQSAQLSSFRSNSFLSVVGTQNGRIIRLTHDFEEVKAFPEKDDYVVICYNDEGDRYWLKQKNRNYLVSLKDGRRKLIGIQECNNFWFSPKGNYLVYFDMKGDKGGYYSYDLVSGYQREISSYINPNLNVVNEYTANGRITIPVGLAGWMEDDAVIVYDNYDIWKLDLAGIKKPINITNGFGRLNKIKFCISSDSQSPFSNSDSVLLIAFNTRSKYNGFYSVKLGEIQNPQLLIMGPWTFCLQGGNGFVPYPTKFNEGMHPIKARFANKWIVMKQSATVAPNYYFTSDFKNLKIITKYQPQEKYNWLTAELVSWKQLDNTLTQGILYRPENFDPNKKYPVIIYYYEQLSHKVYQFPAPYFTGSAHIDIPSFVSRGYLVLTPDIYIKVGKIGQSAYNSVVSGAKWLSQKGYVDAKKIGIASHSWGGFETNYLITHTNCFAAVFEGAGTSNWISSALQLGKQPGKPGKISRFGGYERLMGGTPWNKLNAYLENSPVLRANHITSPLLIFHSKADGAVPWEQAIELFISLRRLDKKVWMLQYDNGLHTVWNKDAVDLTKRVTQFFDHYLKGAKAPLWMTQGIPAKLKGIETGLSLDNTERYP